MVTVFFKPDGGTLFAKAVFLGDMVANYEMLLREKNSNSETSLLTGDNLNPEDDVALLPTPVAINDGRRVVLETGFVGNKPDDNQSEDAGTGYLFLRKGYQRREKRCGGRQIDHQKIRFDGRDTGG